MSHYDWCNKNLWPFFEKIGINPDHCRGIIGAHGDKAYSFQSKWEAEGIPFPHGVAIFLASYMQPYSQQVCWSYTGFDRGLPRVDQWVIQRYPEWKQFLLPV